MHQINNPNHNIYHSVNAMIKRFSRSFIRYRYSYLDWAALSNEPQRLSSLHWLFSDQWTEDKEFVAPALYSPCRHNRAIPNCTALRIFQLEMNNFRVTLEIIQGLSNDLRSAKYIHELYIQQSIISMDRRYIVFYTDWVNNIRLTIEIV